MEVTKLFTTGENAGAVGIHGGCRNLAQMIFTVFRAKATLSLKSGCSDISDWRRVVASAGHGEGTLPTPVSSYTIGGQRGIAQVGRSIRWR